MSHLVTIKTEVRNPKAIERAAARIKGAVQLGHGTHNLGWGNRGEGYGVRLPGMYKPVVFDTKTGNYFCDGDDATVNQHHVDKFLQLYAAEQIRLTAEQNGQIVEEHALPDGGLKLVVTDCN
jgi:hypothetical protein